MASSSPASSPAPSARFPADDGAAHHLLQTALRGARETRQLLLDRHILDQTAHVLRHGYPGRSAIIVADQRSFAVAGAALFAILQREGLHGAPPFLFPDADFPAEYSRVEQLEAALREHSAIPLAVGSGTVNDLVKLASHRLSRPYVAVATAASMDGYAAYGASVSYLGAKQTFDCPAPGAIVADLEIIRQAPPPMTASGYADLIAKVTAGADWLVADALEVEVMEPRAWSIVQDGLRVALADPAGARAGNLTAIRPLMEGLLMGGFAMQAARSSRPASGAEHQFSHLWDMEHHTHDGTAPSHGFKVGLATLLVSSLYEELLRRPLEKLDISTVVAAWPDADQTDRETRSQFESTDFAETALRETAAKHPSRNELERQLLLLRKVWPDLRRRLREQLMPFTELKQRLEAVGAPTQPGQIGLTRERLRRSFRRAYHIRRRFTVLDLAIRTGCLDDCLSVLFGDRGPWGSSSDTSIGQQS